MRHDVVAGRAQHERGHVQRGRILDRLEAVAQHVFDRHHAELALGQRQDRIVRRDQDDRMRGPFLGDLHGHAGAEAAADDCDAARVHVVVRGHPVEQHAGVVDHVRFGRIAVRIAVAAVVHGQHGHAGKEAAGVAHDPRHFLGAAAEIDDGGTRARHLRRHQPAGQARAVLGAQHDGTGTVSGAARMQHFTFDGGIEHETALVRRDRGREAQPQHAGKASHTRRKFLMCAHVYSLLPPLCLFCALPIKSPSLCGEFVESSFAATSCYSAAVGVAGPALLGLVHMDDREAT